MNLFLVSSFLTGALASPISQISGFIPDQYIIVFKNDIHASKINNHWDWLGDVMQPLLPKSSFFNVQGQSKSGLFNTESLDVFGLLHKYDLPEFKGYSIRIPSFVVGLLERHADIELIEKDQILTINDQFSVLGEQKNVMSWGLPRISQRETATTKTYTYPDSAGNGINAYIIDTGIFVAHPEFQGRARIGKSFTEDGTRDGNGHGTHCAGTIGSKTYGVAKNATLIAVKVLDNQGSGSTSNVIAGINWAANDAKKSNVAAGKIKSVANMSLGGGASTVLDRAVKGATESGLVFAIAAGNSAGDACKVSPARVPEAITVAASDKYDKIASFSEKGKCVDIIAPGVDILSTWNNGKTNTISGTSMATPHVCGVVALALAEKDFASVKEVQDYIKAVSSKDKIVGSMRATPNNFLYNNVVKGSFPDNEPKEPKEPTEDPGEPEDDGECPIPQCFFDPSCTSCCVDCLFRGRK